MFSTNTAVVKIIRVLVLVLGELLERSGLWSGLGELLERSGLLGALGQRWVSGALGKCWISGALGKRWTGWNQRRWMWAGRAQRRQKWAGWDQRRLSKIVWLGGSRQRPTVVSESPWRTGKPRRAWTWKDKIVWPGVLSPASVGRSGLVESDGFRQKGKVRWSEGLAVNRQRGWVGLASRRMEKESLSVREALADVRLWFQNRSVGRVILALQLGEPRWRLRSRSGGTSEACCGENWGMAQARWRSAAATSGRRRRACGWLSREQRSWRSLELGGRVWWKIN